MTLDEWAAAALAHQFGNYIDVDGYYQGQCWDLSAHKARHVDGCPSFPTGSGGAEGVYRLFQNPLPQYYTKVANNPSDVNQLPPRGAHIVYGPTATNKYGHIEVVMGANASGVDVIYQDGFNPTQGPIRKFRRWGSLPTMGWLVPKTTAKPELQPYQRIVDTAGVNRRPAPNTQQAPIEDFAAGEVLDFAGWLYGENVSDNNVWFKGRYSDTYFWSGSFKGDADKTGLTDLNPVSAPPVVNSKERIVGDGGLNVRSEPSTLSTILETLPTGSKVTAEGFTTKGALVEGNSTWIKIPQGWVWSGGLTSTATAGLKDLTPTDPITPKPPVNTPVDPVYPGPTDDPLVTAVLNKKQAISPLSYKPNDLVNVGNNQLMRAEAALAFAQMQKAMADDGKPIQPSSGYRSYATQETLYNNYVAKDGQAEADRYSARPGHSEHQTGLTMDLNDITEAFAKTPQYTWLKANAHKFGFIERYPEDKESVTGYMFEPWHWRYIGVSAATDMFNKKVTTLEEYYKVPGGLYPDQEKPTDPGNPTTPTDPVPVPPTPTDPGVPDPADPPNSDQNLLPSYIRTLVPYLVGLVVSWLTTKGINVPENYQSEAIATLTVVFGQLYYIIIRWLETRVNPRLGVLLGKAKAPTYPVNTTK